MMTSETMAPPGLVVELRPPRGRFGLKVPTAGGERVRPDGHDTLAVRVLIFFL